MYTTHSPCFFLPLLIPPFAPLFNPSLLTWNPPCCDRIRPPRSQVVRKLTSPFPSPGSYTPLPKIPTPRGFPDPNIHSLGRHCEPDPQARAQYCNYRKGYDKSFRWLNVYVFEKLYFISTVLTLYKQRPIKEIYSPGRNIINIFFIMIFTEFIEVQRIFSGRR